MKKTLIVCILLLIYSMNLTAQGAGEKNTGTELNFNNIPSPYMQTYDEGGRVERLDYVADYHGRKFEKHAYIYLPFDYEERADRRYNSFYLMHGGSGQAETFFGGVGRTSSLKVLLDNMIAKGDIEPMIVVTPSYYNPASSDDALLVSEFHSELSENLIPAVDEKYRTLTARENRAFGGFSMGSVTTWYTFINNLPEFKYFMPMSGDSWVIETMGGRTKTAETAGYIGSVPEKYGITPADFLILAATGTKDMAYENLTDQIEEMKKINDVFHYGTDFNSSNLYYMVAEGGVHTYAAMNDYIYNLLPYFFD